MFNSGNCGASTSLNCKIIRALKIFGGEDKVLWWKLRASGERMIEM